MFVHDPAMYCTTTGHEDSSSGESGVQLHLLAFPVSPLEGGSLSLSLISSGSLLTPQDDSLVCEWTRNDTQLCVSENSTVHSETDGRFELCTQHIITEPLLQLFGNLLAELNMVCLKHEACAL